MKARHDKPAHVSQADWDGVDVPEMTDAEFAAAKPLNEVSPELHASWKRGPGRPLAESPKVHINFRLAADLVEDIKASGRGYNARVENAIREAFAKGRF